MRLRGLALLVFCLAGAARAETRTLLIAAPFKDLPAIAGQIADGAAFAAKKAGWAVETLDSGCGEVTTAETLDAAQALQPAAIIGLPCSASLASFVRRFGASGVPIVTVANRGATPVSAEELTRPLHVGPREDAEAKAAADLLLARWQGRKFALLDDGSAAGRRAGDALRLMAEERGTPAALVASLGTDANALSGLMRRLKGEGVDAAFVAGGGSAITALQAAGDTGTVEIAAAESLALQGGEPLPDGLLIVARHQPLTPAFAAELASARTTPFTIAEGYTADAHVAAEVAMQRALQAGSTSFDTAFGMLTTADDGFLEPVTFKLFTVRDGALSEIAP